MTRLRVVPDEDTSVPQTRVGQRLLDGYAVPIEPAASVVLADVVAILADEDTAEDVADYALAVVTRLARLHGFAVHPAVPA